MTRTLRVVQLGTFLALPLMLIAGCQRRTADLRATSSGRQDTDQPSQGTWHQVTLNVTGMS